MLLNECEAIFRGDQAIYLAGIDDAHYYRVDNIEKAASEIPDKGFSILLSHTPEIYHQAAHGGFDLLVSGHTHGGQICLPGSIPITLDSGSATAYGLRPVETWRYGGLYVGRRGYICRSRPHQLLCRNYAASSPISSMGTD